MSSTLGLFLNENLILVNGLKGLVDCVNYTQLSHIRVDQFFEITIVKSYLEWLKITQFEHSTKKFKNSLTDFSCLYFSNI